MWTHIRGYLLGSLVVLGVAEGGLRLAGLFFQLDKRAGETQADVTILCAGDSFTYGIGGRAFPRQVQEILSNRPDTPTVSTINEGVPGLNTALLADQIPGQLETYDPDVVLIIIGENNSWNTVRLDDAAGSMSLMQRLDQVLLEYSRVYKFVKIAFIGIDDNTFHEAAEEDVANPAQQAANYILETEEIIGYSNESWQARAQPPLGTRREWKGLVMLSEEGRYEDSIEQVSAFLERVPEFSGGWHELGGSYMRVGKMDEAIEALERARGIEGAHTEVWFSLGHAYEHRGDIDEAVAVWREGLERWPTSITLYKAMATTLFRHRTIWDTVSVVESIEGINENLLHQYLLQIRAAAPEGGVGDLVLESTRKDIARIVEAVHAHGAEVIFGSYPDNGFPEIQQTVVSLGGRYIDFVPYFDERFERREDYLSADRCHCTTEGYRLMAEIFAEEVIDVMEW